MQRKRLLTLILILAAPVLLLAQRPGFVSARGGKLYLDGKPYYFVGTNYWYGSLLGLEKDKRRGIVRLRKELDFLKAHGVTNLRLMAGAEGEGLINGVTRVGPALQPRQGEFDETVLDGLDIVLAEMGKRHMKAVVFLSNNWEWSGGFQQYLMWNGVESDEYRTKKPTWDEQRDIVAKFYTCRACTDGYLRQAAVIVDHKNHINGKRYTDDPAIMAWELANEPRPMRPRAIEAYKAWVASAAAFIRANDKQHLLTIGTEGWIGTENIAVYEAINADRNVDYLTIHIWPKNWGWFEGGKMAEGMERVLAETEKYIRENAAVAVRLNKPLVIEEFGLPRDGGSFDPASGTTLRDRYYDRVLSHIGRDAIAGAAFWAFGGTARPKPGQTFWQNGDERLGDPPMEEQGLNSVFDIDLSTWKTIGAANRAVKKL